MKSLGKYIRHCALIWLTIVTAHSAAAASQDAMDFELATLGGDAFVKISDYANRPVLINVWGSECPPCIKETPLLNGQSAVYSNIQFLGIATDDRVVSTRFVEKFQLAYPQLQAPKNPAGLLRHMGDAHGALPFTVMLDSAHRICASKTGEVDLAWINDTFRKCAK